MLEEREGATNGGGTKGGVSDGGTAIWRDAATCAQKAEGRGEQREVEGGKGTIGLAVAAF